MNFSFIKKHFMEIIYSLILGTTGVGDLVF